MRLVENPSYGTLKKREWRARNPRNGKEADKRYRTKHREKWLLAMKRRYFKRKYGITLEDRDILVAKAENKCEICRKPFSSQRNTHVDHCHVSGVVRGMLCGPCNGSLGWFEMYKTTVEQYLKRV